MNILNKKLNDKMTLISVDNVANEVVVSVGGKEHTIHATTLKSIKNGDYVLFRYAEIGQVYDYSQGDWQGTNRCFFDLEYIFSETRDSRYAFLKDDLPVYIINDLVKNLSSFTYNELLMYVKKLEQELTDLRDNNLKEQSC